MKMKCPIHVSIIYLELLCFKKRDLIKLYEFLSDLKILSIDCAFGLLIKTSILLVHSSLGGIIKTYTASVRKKT